MARAEAQLAATLCGNERGCLAPTVQKRESIMIASIKRHLHQKYLRFTKRTYGFNWMNDIDQLTESKWTPRVIFDVGANVGQTAAELCRHWRAAHVHSFEPVTSTYEVLCANTRHIGRVQCHNLALGDENKSVTINAVPFSDRNSLVAQYDDAMNPGVPTEINVTTLDSITAGLGLSAVDVLKTDTEGYDLQVLRGASRLLRSGGIQWVYSEVTFLPKSTQQASFPALNAFLNEHGLECVGIYDGEGLWPRRWGSYCNALFSTRELVSHWRKR